MLFLNSIKSNAIGSCVQNVMFKRIIFWIWGNLSVIFVQCFRVILIYSLSSEVEAVSTIFAGHPNHKSYGCVFSIPACLIAVQTTDLLGTCIIYTYFSPDTVSPMVYTQDLKRVVTCLQLKERVTSNTSNSFLKNKARGFVNMCVHVPFYKQNKIVAYSHFYG